MDIRKETRRERRIRDRRRMVKKAYRIIVRQGWYPIPDDPYRKNGPETWEEVFEVRYEAAKRIADNLKFCSGGISGKKGRRLFSYRSTNEYRLNVGVVQQLEEVGWLGERGGRRPRFYKERWRW